MIVDISKNWRADAFRGTILDMKAKITFIIQTIGMYVMHLPLYALLVVMRLSMDVDLQESISKGLLIASLVLMLLVMPVCILNIAASIRSAVKDDPDVIKTTMVAKLSLIPWYALNFLIGYAFVGIFFNPFMMIAIPIIIALLVAATYILMLTTSVGDVAYFLRKVIKKEWRVRPSAIFAVIFLFIFCLDVVGSIILYVNSKKYAVTKPDPIEPVESAN